VEIQGREHLDAALAGGKGVLLLSAHLGYPHIIDLVLRRMGYEVRHLTGMPEEQASYFTDLDLSRWPWLNWAAGRLLRLPVFVPPFVTSLNVRPLFSFLGGNGALVVLADGLAASRIVTSRVLEVPMPIAASTLELGRARGTPYLPAFLIRKRLSRPRLTLVIHERLEMQYSEDRDADMQVNADSYTRILEAYVLAYPHLYEGFDYRSRFRFTRLDVADRYNAAFDAAPPDPGEPNR
jgi:KDO2-lipid IV(A) lauroyltransferase